MKPGVLYLSYDGMLEPLGESQVLAYLERLTAEFRVHLVSFEKPKDCRGSDSVRVLKHRLNGKGINWVPLQYHKRPTALATSWDILAGIFVGTYLMLRYRLSIIHARSYVPSAMALTIKRVTGRPFVFDMRGFWADERVDGGIWPNHGKLYAIAKWFEKRFLLGADHVISLTDAAVREMRRFEYLLGQMPPVTVIPTCADLALFRRTPASFSRKEHFVLGYVGSVGTWYLFDEVLTCFAELRRCVLDAKFLILNRNEQDYIRSRLEAFDIPSHTVEILSAPHSEVPGHVARMDAGIFFIKPVFSKQASAPTKLAEFLGCGVPCLANAGVGDMADILESERVGIAIDDFGADTLATGIHRLLALVAEPGTSDRCVEAAHRHFSLAEGVARYRNVYRTLA